MDITLDENFWTERYIGKNTGWDIGEVSTPLKEYIDQLSDYSLQILIPGGGNSYEAEYLHLKGYKNVYVADLATPPLQNLKKRCPNFPKDHLLHADFFELDMRFDLIIEQTFFCAINPQLRNRYAMKMHELLKPKGKLAGVLFDAPLNDTHPPFGGTKKEYFNYFDPLFTLKVFEECYNSIAPRKGTELFILFEKKLNY